VRYLFFVPHTAAAVSLEADGGTKPIVPAVLESGYRIIAEQAKYGSSHFLAERALYPYVHYYLFEKSAISEANPAGNSRYYEACATKDLQTLRKRKLAGRETFTRLPMVPMDPLAGRISSMQQFILLAGAGGFEPPYGGIKIRVGHKFSQ